jgi:hypothetical protein
VDVETVAVWDRLAGAACAGSFCLPNSLPNRSLVVIFAMVFSPQSRNKMKKFSKQKVNSGFVRPLLYHYEAAKKAAPLPCQC